MDYFPPALENLVGQFAKLPGVGRKSAQRLAFFILDQPDDEAKAFCWCHGAPLKTAISCCPVCQESQAEGTCPCPMCASSRRDHTVICVVADPKDVIAMERGREYHGLYHVLHGVISPMNHVRTRMTCASSGLLGAGDRRGGGGGHHGHQSETQRERPPSMISVPPAQTVWGQNDPAGLWYPSRQSLGVCRRCHIDAGFGRPPGDLRVGTPTWQEHERNRPRPPDTALNP